MIDWRLKNKWDKAAQEYAIKEACQEARHQAMLETARGIAGKLKKKGCSVEFVAGITELSVKEIASL